jgi:hypothetical protein
VSDSTKGALIGTIIVWVILLGVLGSCWALPHYNVWQQGLAGEAELKRASQNRQIAVQEAEAKHEAAKALAQAEIERAKGVAEANRIIGESLHGNEDYLRYLWVQGLEHAETSVIYVPTEANLPLLEATRLTNKPQPQPK